LTFAIAFAVPGDIRTLTGGYLYDLKLCTALSDLGVEVRHMAWGKSFPNPSQTDAAKALDQLRALPAECPALIDGLGFAALAPQGLEAVAAPLFALVHHPLALEPGLDPATARAFAEREKVNLVLARHVFVTSGHTAGILEAQYGVAPSRITVVRPGFDRPGIIHAPEKAEPPMILSVGLLARRKGHDVLLRALAQITDLAWQADIVGRDHEGGALVALHSLASDLGLEARVRFSGEIGGEALQQRFKGATVFALATRYEGYGIVFGEAMCHGLPIVSTTAGAVPETVGDEAGLLVAPDDPQAFAGALRRMLTDATLRASCAQASRKAATRLATWPEAAGLVRDRISALAKPLSDG
jgi:glycosyltransferase involved in cell wall biosynthesis